jgi:hypothetical protein
MTRKLTKADVDFVNMDPAAWWSGYDPENEDREALLATAQQYDFASIPRAATVPDRFSIADWWDTEQQGPVGRCAGEAGAACAEVEYYKTTGNETQFNGHFTYILAQNRTHWRGSDNGTSCQSVATSLKEDGACPMDWDRDGRVDYPKPPGYTTRIPEQARAHAAKYRFSFHSILKSMDDIVAFQQTQGVVFVGGDWGNWGPNSAGLCDRFIPGGGGHAWAMPGWDFSRQRFATEVIEGVNSHGLGWGKRGFHWMTRRFIDAFLSHRNTVVVGMSKLAIPGAETKYDYSRWRKAIST